MANKHNEATILYNVYLDGVKLAGTASADLPTVSALTTEVTGAGIAGAVDIPVMGLFQAMAMTLNFRTVTRDFKDLMNHQMHHIELWAAIQVTDPDTGSYSVAQHKFITRAIPKNLTPGSFAVGSTQDRTLEYEVTYLKETYAGEELYEIDKYNMIYSVGGVDLMAAAREAAGE
ncbi:phage major tail tube protein [Serratia sp. MF2]|uniref:phage major tail tube protein n=1 Tax=Serratia sp. MF1(2023) TaxID=3059171 RepID=UPI0027E87572|nr:phage major tail tube protein [Serratia sp. MF1(2023)]MDQ7104209.1 phage major tail tube protein [Serratia sp. MF1(2023)]